LAEHNSSARVKGLNGRLIFVKVRIVPPAQPLIAFWVELQNLTYAPAFPVLPASAGRLCRRRLAG
jgi:hypothetical protein